MQNACMTTITIRDVPKDVHAILVARAGKQGRSLQELLKAILEREASRPDMSDLIERIEKRVKSSESHLTVEQILEYKDADKR